VKKLSTRERAELETNSAMATIDRPSFEIDDMMMRSQSFDTQSMHSAVTRIRTNSMVGPLSQVGHGSGQRKRNYAHHKAREMSHDLGSKRKSMK